MTKNWKIGIINYNAGNAQSVFNTVEEIGYQGKLITDPDLIKEQDIIILPGVGSAKATMDSLDAMGMIEELNEWTIAQKKPYLGICIGYQIIYNYSEEDDQECLGWIKGEVKKFDEQKVLVPQIGWNAVVINESHPQSSYFSKVTSENAYYYFVNSFFANPAENHSDTWMFKTDYGENFTSMVVKDNIVATQFHLEKSGTLGLKLMKEVFEYFDAN